MAPNDIDELGQRIVASRLVSPRQLDECLAALGPASTTSQFLHEMERLQHLTSYQTGIIRRGDFSGLVLGDYKLMYRNASGSFARVFRACSVIDDSMLGLKLLRQRWAKAPDCVALFHREAMICRKLQHKNIVPIYDVGSQGDFHFFTMEFVEGGNLRDFINIRKTLSPQEATRCIVDMAEGLDYGANLGITHRDLKLTNVLMSSKGVAKLVDFGLAGDNSAANNSYGAETGRALEYATLEKGSRAPNNDPRSDLFFLGVIFYELLTGEPPYPRTRDRFERKQLKRYADIQPIQVLQPNLPPPVVEIVNQLLQVNPADRFQSSRDVINAGISLLRQWEQGAANPTERDSTDAAPSDKDHRTIMIVERRTKHQNLLREYLSKHAFRVLFSTDVDRALKRLETQSPPECLVFIGDSLDESEVMRGYCSIAREGSNGSASVIAVLPSGYSQNLPNLPENERARILTQPVTLRSLRNAISQALARDLSLDTPPLS
jgi:serine/threonine protein kinase